MLFPTIEFLIFFLCIFFASWLLVKKHITRKIFLIIASYFFYGFWDYRFTFLLFFITFVSYVYGLLISRANTKSGKKFHLAINIIICIGILAFYKYYGFFSLSLNNFFVYIGLKPIIPFFEVILPVGISFFTFQSMSYTIDIYRNEINASKSFIDVILYISFFPQLVAGPIVRAKDFIPQLTNTVDKNSINANRAFILIISGLFKKAIIANYLATLIIDPVFGNPNSYSPVDILFAVYAYAVQIFCDFSGYTDIAIGVAILLGYYFPDNFNSPYRSITIQDFWRRWHISLSTWLKDYLYIPLGGSKKGKFRTYVNLLITMLLGGLWHGAALNFIIWGGIHGIGLAVERMILGHKKVEYKSIIFKIIGMIFTFHFVCFSWIFFRSSSFSNAMEYLKLLFTSNNSTKLLNPFIFFLIFIGILIHFIPHNLREKFRHFFTKLPVPVQGAVLAIIIIILCAMFPEGVAPFIYFQF